MLPEAAVSPPPEILESHRGLDALPEKTFSDFAHLAALICETPLAAICLVDGERQWLRAFFGAGDHPPRRVPFCTPALLTPHTILEVRDARTDPRFATEPLVQDAAGFGFYAGAPLMAENGQAIGAICVLDFASRSLRLHQLDGLQLLAGQLMEQSRRQREFADAVGLLDEQNELGKGMPPSPHPFASVMDQIPSTSHITEIRDGEGFLAYCNDALALKTGRPAEELIGKPLFELFGPDITPIMANNYQVLSENRLLTFEEVTHGPDGQEFVWLSLKFPIQRGGPVQQVGGISIEISDRKRALAEQRARLETSLERFKELSQTSSLTQLFNKRAFNDVLRKEFEPASTASRIILLVADIDHFKQINDRLGHAVGDEVLRRLGQLIKKNCRPGDFPARWGGEEFAILLRETSPEDARKLAERLRQTVEAAEWPGGCRVTISIGLADRTPAIADPAAFFAAADAALYEAKQTGRNRVVFNHG